MFGPAGVYPPGPVAVLPGAQHPSQACPGTGRPPHGPRCPDAAGGEPGVGPRRRSREGRTCSVGSRLWSHGHTLGTSALRCPLGSGRCLCVGHSWARWSPGGHRHRLCRETGSEQGAGGAHPSPTPTKPGRGKSPCVSVVVSPKPLLGQPGVLASTKAREAIPSGRLWAGRQPGAPGALQPRLGSARVKTGRWGQERTTQHPQTHLTWPCLHSFPVAVFRTITLSFGGNSHEHAVHSLRSSPRFPCSRHPTPRALPGQPHPWWW